MEQAELITMKKVYVSNGTFNVTKKEIENIYSNC